MMNKQKKDRNNLLAITGAAAVFAIAVNVGITVINSQRRNRKRKDLRGSNVRVNLSAPEILKLADRVIAKSKQVHDAVASVPFDKVSYKNVILPLADLEAQQFPLVQSCIFPKMVTTSEDVRKASAEAERRIDAHDLCCRQREDVYRVVKAFAARGEWVSLEAKRYTQFLIRDFERNGMNITLTKREELQRLRAQIDEQIMQYIQNLNDETTFLLFGETELVGLPPEFLKSLDKDRNDKLKISLKSHHVSPVLELCKKQKYFAELESSAKILADGRLSLVKQFGTALTIYPGEVGLTRRAVTVAYGRRCEANLPVLEKLVQLRHKSARLLGFSNYADFAVDPRMAKSSSKVLDLLEDISAGLTDSAMKELNVLKDLKKKEEGEVSFGIEDIPYYVKRVEERFNLDFAAVKQYFPTSLVMSGIFKIYQDLFGLRFEEVTDAEVWHSDVQLFSVFDLGSSELLGYFYLDLYSREGKYGHTCVVALQNGSFMDGVRQIPLALLISQIQKEVVGHPGLLRFSEVVNLLHEFGHVVHQMCNRATFARFSGLRLDPDFVEIPAQVFENWCYEGAALKLISGFHQDITMPIKDEICSLIKRWRCSFSALKLKQEILYCLFDQIIYSTENIDIVGLFKHLHSKVMLGLPMLEGTNPASCYPRTAIGYEAACYSRIWSEVFAADIFASKFRDDIFNQQAGMQFRNKVLAPGGSKDPIELLSDFLGREPSIQAFIDAKVCSI